MENAMNYGDSQLDIADELEDEALQVPVVHARLHSLTCLLVALAFEASPNMNKPGGTNLASID